MSFVHSLKCHTLKVASKSLHLLFLIPCSNKCWLRAVAVPSVERSVVVCGVRQGGDSSHLLSWSRTLSRDTRDNSVTLQHYMWVWCINSCSCCDGEVCL